VWKGAFVDDRLRMSLSRLQMLTWTIVIVAALGTMAIARWVGSLDRTRVQRVLDGAVDPEDLDALYEGDDVVVGFGSERKLAA